MRGAVGSTSSPYRRRGRVLNRRPAERARAADEASKDEKKRRKVKANGGEVELEEKHEPATCAMLSCVKWRNVVLCQCERKVKNRSGRKKSGSGRKREKGGKEAKARQRNSEARKETTKKRKVGENEECGKEEKTGHATEVGGLVSSLVHLTHLGEGEVVTRFPWANLRKDHSHMFRTN